MDFGNNKYINEADLESKLKPKVEISIEDVTSIDTRSPGPVKLSINPEYVNHSRNILGSLIYNRSARELDQFMNGEPVRETLIRAIKIGYIGVDFDVDLIGIIHSSVAPEIPVLAEIRKLYCNIRGIAFNIDALPTFTVSYFGRNGAYLRSAKM